LIVIDASACADFVLGTEDAEWVRERVEAEEMLHAPHVVDFEFLSVMRAVRNRATAIRALDDFYDLRLVRYRAEELAIRVWELRGHLTAYDASYVALAEALGLRLLTTDRKLARAGGHRAVVEAPT
jgi:predicted nucleic acid-binding protein